MREITAEIERWLTRGERIALATVVATRRSAPRAVGAKLAVSPTGALAGSVSGGCVENDVTAHALEVLAGAPPRLLSYGIADDFALEVGLPCGGEIDVFVEAGRPETLERLIRAARSGERAVRLVVVDGESLGAELLLLEGGERIGDAAELADVAPDRSGLIELGARTVFADVYAPPPQILVFGAVDLSEELCRAARALGWRTVVADPRARLATRERVPSADEVLAVWPEEALARVAPDRETAVVVLTHEERFDVPIIQGALETDALYIGALGSRRTQEARRERLREAGVDEEALERIFGPCGLDIGAATPAETALSILAEIVAARSGRSGGPLKETRGRIHAHVG